MTRSGGWLLSVVYRSAAIPGLGAAELDELLGAARVKNRREGVTGMLLAENGRFVQALEGPEATVLALMETIEADPRHEHLRVLARQAVPSRRFGDWAMARGHIGEMESMPLAQWFEALVDAREELPTAPSRVRRAVGWFRARPRVVDED